MARKIPIEQVRELAKFVETNNEKALMEVMLTGETVKDSCAVVGINESTGTRIMQRLRRRAALQGYSPDHGMTHTVPDTHFVKGVSSLYKSTGTNGEPILQWVKSDRNVGEVKRVIKELIAAMVEEVPRYPEVMPIDDEEYFSDYLAVYPMGDPHLGLLSCIEESGEDISLESAANDLYAATARLVRSLPPCKEALIINVGDLFHTDNKSNQTTRGHNKLDVSSNWPIILKVAIKTLRQCIDVALESHEKVTVINCPGNHDDHSAVVLATCLSVAYEGNPRVNIINEPKDYFSYRFGKNLIGAYHGHQIKRDRLPLVMANTWPNDWGETDYRVWYTGHIHHDTVHEYDGCTVETVRTLNGRDRYSVDHGYNSHRDMKAILHHRDHGPVERHTVTIGMAREYLEKIKPK